jgi:hypothetical protein
MIAVIRRARVRMPGYDPQLKTSVAARLAGITPRRLRTRHRSLGIKIERRWFWRWTSIEQILAGRIP